jgi:DnaA family protein
MRQLLLDLGASKPPTLETFVVGQNAELVQRLHRLTTSDNLDLSERFVYLWGQAGAGKSHLLQALLSTQSARYINANAHAEAFLFTPNVSLYLVDDCDKLHPDLQIEAFNLFNQIRENGGVLICSGSLPPAKLTVREDLRTRLGWGLIYHVHGLTDEEKIAALTQTAFARGIVLSNGVLPYLITHFRRDMQSLSTMLDALDQYSLETKRPITLPLLRELLQQEGETK